MLIAPPRSISAADVAGASGAAGKAPEQSECSDGPRGKPAEGVAHGHARKRHRADFPRQGSAAAPARPLNFVTYM
eukprot:15196793-Alexandrium_andersonii.AAC.1